MNGGGGRQHSTLVDISKTTVGSQCVCRYDEIAKNGDVGLYCLGYGRRDVM